MVLLFHQTKIDGFVKSPSAVLSFTGKGLNVRKVSLALSRLARLAYEAFYKAVGHVCSWAVTCPIVIEMKKLGLFKRPSKAEFLRDHHLITRECV